MILKWLFDRIVAFLGLAVLWLLISLYRYQVYHCNRYHASAAIGTVRIAANGTMIIGSALLGAKITIFSFSDA